MVCDLGKRGRSGGGCLSILDTALELERQTGQDRQKLPTIMTRPCPHVAAFWASGIQSLNELRQAVWWLRWITSYGIISYRITSCGITSRDQPDRDLEKFS